MEAHELAKEIHNNNEKRKDQEAQRYLGDLVNQVAQEVRLNPEFFLDRYEQSESGYVYLEKSQETYYKQSSGFYDNQCTSMNKIIVHYLDSVKKNDYILGYVSRDPCDKYLRLGLAACYENGCCDGLGKQIYPGDEEWDAIVGSVERAILISQKKSPSPDIEID